MASEEKLCQQIADIISRPKNVDCGEVVRVLEQLNSVSRPARHGTIFKIPGCTKTLMLNEHNDGKKHLPSYCVKQFAACMIELGLYGQD